MSIVEKIMDYKRQYDEMDPYRRNQLNIAVFGTLLIIITMYLLYRSVSGIGGFFKN